MRRTGWTDGPFGLDDDRGATRRASRTVLMVVHNPTAGTRLTDVFPLVASDPRVQTVWTVPPGSVFVHGARDFVDGLDVAQIPWDLAIRTPFDLAVAAQDGMLERVHAPVLTMSHGVGFGKYPTRWDGRGRAVPHDAGGPERGWLVARGRVVPSVIIVADEWQVGQISRICQEAAPAAVVAGDPCYDRMLKSVPYAAEYRRALGVPAGGKLVLVSSTWGRGSLFGSQVELITQLVRELPPSEFRVVVALHPNIWTWHGGAQIRAWYADCLRAGMVLLPLEEGWRAAAVAADWVIGDHGSVSYYAAAMGTPVLLATFPHDEIDPRSQVAYLGEVAPMLRANTPIRRQLDQAITAIDPEQLDVLRTRLTSTPGVAARIIRREMYRLMDLPEPATPAWCDPVPVPRIPNHPDWPGASGNG